MTDAPPKPGPVAHRCCVPGCGRWACFGYTADPLAPKAERVSHWYCADHRPGTAVPPAAAPAPEPKKSTPPAKPGQGRLL